MTITLGDIDPKRLVSANRRIHYHVRAEVCDYWRTLARKAAEDAYGVADVDNHWHHRVRIVIGFEFPDRRRRDVGNLYPYVAKPIVDGLVDARVIRDDDDYHLIGPDLRRVPNKGSRIFIDIEDLS